MMDAPPALFEVRVPTVLRIGAYRFYFHSREHDPPHIHVESADARATFELSPVAMVKSTGYTRRDLRQIREMVVAHRGTFLDRWHDYFDI